MAVTNYSAARRSGFKVGNDGVGKTAAITMTKMGTRTLYIPLQPSTWHFSGTSVDTTEDGVFTGVLFPNANVATMHITTRLPAEWYSSSSSISIEIFWKTTATSGDAKFSISIAPKENGETTALTETVTKTTTTNSTANKLNKTTQAFTFSNFAASDWIGIYLTRDPNDGDDTLNTNLTIIGINIVFTGTG